MESKTRLYLEEKSRVFKALGHPTRLFIVESLAEKEMCVCELTDIVGSDISTISKHLSVLKNANIISDDKRGKKVYYSLKIPCVLNFLPCVEDLLKAVAQQQQHWLEERQI